jgi:hypothetical protein
MPKIYQYVAQQTDLVIDHYNALGGRLSRAFPKSAWPAATFNFAPRVVTAPHKDRANAPAIPCSITPSGSFNSELGGHLVLYELGLVIEFPAGSNILICSGSITHYNLPIADSESRASFTQYFAGGLARHVAYGYKVEKDLKMEDRRAFADAADARWLHALQRFSTEDTLEKDRKLMVKGVS